MKGNRTILALCVVTGMLAGGSYATAAQQANEAPSVEFYRKNFGKRLSVEAECRNQPELASTQKCVNARKAANAVSKKLGMPLEYPEVENNGR